jgi:hypothetical protein
MAQFDARKNGGGPAGALQLVRGRLAHRSFRVGRCHPNHCMRAMVTQTKGDGHPDKEAESAEHHPHIVVLGHLRFPVCARYISRSAGPMLHSTGDQATPAISNEFQMMPALSDDG